VRDQRNAGAQAGRVVLTGNERGGAQSALREAVEQRLQVARLDTLLRVVGCGGSGVGGEVERDAKVMAVGEVVGSNSTAPSRVRAAWAPAAPSTLSDRSLAHSRSKQAAPPSCRERAQTRGLPMPGA
jgi:hypothetical protein